MFFLYYGVTDFYVGFLAGSQVDKYGNINTTVIGDYDRPKSRLPGSGGANPIGALAKRVIIIALHDTRRLADRLEESLVHDAGDVVLAQGPAARRVIVASQIDLAAAKPTGPVGLMFRMMNQECRQGLGVAVEMTRALGKISSPSG